MAERRMFAKTIIDSDSFLDMPLSAQALYFHLSMRADDDGFINNPKKIQRMIGASDDDCKLLLAKRFVIAFESGIVVIKHWKIHNYIRNDRYKPTVYTSEKAMLTSKENGAYIEAETDGIPFGIPNGYQMDTKCIQDGYQMDTQDRIGKDSIDKVSIGEDMEPLETASPSPKKPIRHKYGEYQNVLLSDSDLEKLKAEFPTDYESRIERLSEYIASTGKSYKNHLATIRNWSKRDTKSNLQNADDSSKPSFDVNSFFNQAVQNTMNKYNIT